jgi:class 3 adenylate cyclase/tetratricopeptide (TPR) repeat protein
VRCPNCGAENAEQALFCSSCGAQLGETPPSGGEERKIVSVLFVDLVGFTARSDGADPEDVRSMLRVYHDLLRREIERFGGTLEKFIGDAVMAVFGAPVTHEDDAERATRAALRIVDAIAELNRERPDLDLAIRGAVNTGEALVTLGARPEHGEGLVTGDVVNIASRLQAVAPVGGVVVGELTHRATRVSIDYEELQPVTVRGKGDSIRIWRAVAARSRFGVDVEVGTRTPLIGREHELSLLRDLYRRAAREQSPQLVTLSGEPGVGKTRLTWEFQRFIDDEPDLVYWRQGRCLPYGEGITFWALGEIVKSHAGIVENDGPDQAADKLARAVEAVVEQGSERDWIRARLAPLIGMGTEAGSAQREESFAAWRTFLEAIAASRPFVVVIEDLHWADPAMLAFVEHLGEWASGVPLLVLCTARPELYDRQPGWGGGKRNHTAVSLSPLSPDETARLIAALLDQAVLPAKTQAALLARASGNPLYAEEFIRMLIDRNVLARHGSSWELAGVDEVEIPLPESVHALIAARLDTLTAGGKALLQDAAVIGKVFWAGALAEMGGLDRRGVREGLHDLARKELIRPARRPSIEGETEYAFWHLLIRDVAYGQIPRAARALKHRAAAEWIERIAGERVADSAELLAYHFEQALQLWRVAGGDASELESHARRFLMLAGERAERLDTTKAITHFERALELTPPGHPHRVQALLHAGRAFWGTGRLSQSEAWCDEALEAARGSGDALGEGEALTWLSKLAWATGDTVRQFELLEEAVRILEALPPGPELASAYARLTAAYGLAWRPAETMRAAKRALAVVREYGSEADLMTLLQFRGQARADFGDVEGGFEDAREGLRLALESAPAALAAAANVNLGDMTWVQHGPVKGQELYEAAADLAERRGAPGAADWARMESMWTRFDLGQWDELLAIGGRILAHLKGAETSQLWVLTEAYRRDVLLHRGIGDADEVVEGKILPRAREIGDGQVLVPAFRVAALGRVARGDVSGAVDLVRELDELLRDRPGPRSWILDGAARVCRAADEAGLLRRLIHQGGEHVTRDRNSMASARAMLAEMESDHERALEAYEDAAVRWEAFPAVLGHGLALMGMGRCLLALGRQNEATKRLRAAAERFGALKAAPLVAEVDDLLARTTAKTSEAGR